MAEILLKLIIYDINIFKLLVFCNVMFYKINTLHFTRKYLNSAVAEQLESPTPNLEVKN